jgi:non-specific serine/threonine protein kinase
MSATSGQMLSHYRLVEQIGEGGMGVVWKAEDTVLNRTVAIKVLPADVSRDQKRRELFLREAQLASQVSHANIVQVHEFGREGDLDFIVMECVEGKPLNKLLHGRPLPPEKVVEFAFQVARALSRAHRKQLLHRDLKPANILVTPDGDVKIVDFGLALLFQRDETTALSEAVTCLEEQEGRLTGTLAYMSPEQARMESLDARSDMFSLGTILYEMTTGQLPFSAPTNLEVLEAIRRARPTPVHDLVPHVPLELDRIIRKAMAPRRAERYQDVEDLAVDLKQLGKELESGSSPSYESLQEAAGPRVRWISRGPIVVIASLVVAAVAVGSWWFVFGPGATLDERTLLIVPLQVRADEDGGAYAGQALSEGIAINVSRAPDLRVLPVPTASQPDTDTALDTARRSAAGLLLTGSLVRDGDRVDVKLSLIDVSENRIRWGLQREVPDGDFSILVSRAAESILKELGAEVPALHDYPERLSGDPEMAASR